ncbi:nitrile hydratase subunit beta [Streptomyces sp. SA15]|uniref:nitrile hydratase subunit beta n=1 Tax=Streptomyces sp. SA15 TaxID=934019 RepID=UPI000BB0C525|nr:nitrile hydratase subunit beta [Streptomyces sp. SA15]PAZ10264.1 nitrile hydratase subunit beta [Streptomyces sp. SA15]
MKLQHHLGGLENLGRVSYEPRVFVEDWEQRIFGVHVAMMGLSAHLGDAVPRYPIEEVPTALSSIWTWADLRKGAEAMHPFAYFQYRYYEKWLGGISGFFVSQGYITEEELEAKAAEYLQEPELELPGGGDEGIDDQVIRYLRAGDSPCQGPAESPAFAVGDRVTVKDVPPTEHTRLPGNLRGRTGTVERVFEGNYGYFCSTGPDGIGEPMPVYAVRFEPAGIWGELAEPGAVLYGELYQAYLTPVMEEQQ